MTRADLLARFEHQTRVGDQVNVRCPAHDDRTASLTIGEGDDGRLLLHCKAGCTFEAVLERLGLTKGDVGPTTTKPTPAKTIVATYDYTDASGALLYQVVRYNPKGFRQRQPNGKGQWIWNLKNVERVLYRLPALQNQPIVVIVEGEKDADCLAALGFAATTNASGASKWKLEFCDQLKRAGVRQVVVIPDNDPPGHQHAQQIATSCLAAGVPFRIVPLPDVPAKGDVSDWLDAGHTRDELLALMDEPSVDLAGLLTQTQTFIRKFVVLTEDQATLSATWVAHTHAIDAFDCTAYKQITSATPEAGKTRFLEVLACVVANPWLTGRTSAAALVRKVDAESPTLLLDESDANFGAEKEYAEVLRGILNTGYSRSGRTTLCVGQGAALTFRDFSTFCPKAIAGIGTLPATIVSRAIRFELKRRTKHEAIAKFRQRDAVEEAEPIHRALAAWALGAIDSLRRARPFMPAGLRDRAEDVLEPLLAIADSAGGTWPARVRKAAVAMMGTPSLDDVRLELLADIRDAFTKVDAGAEVTWISTQVLLQQLTALEERRWATWRKGDKPLTAEGLARLLRPFGVIPTSNGSERGYARERFADAWTRYLAPDPDVNPSTRHDANDSGPQPDFSTRHSPEACDGLKTQETPIKTVLGDGLTGCTSDHEVQTVSELSSTPS